MIVLKNVYGTPVFTCKPNETFTDVAIPLIDARPVVLTGLRGAFIDVNLTVVTLKTRHTVTLIHINRIHTDGTVPAGQRQTLVDIFFTVLTPKAPDAPALVPIWCPNTGGVIKARLIRAVSHSSPTLTPAVSTGTVTGISINTINTMVFHARARVALALVDVVGTVGFVEAVRTQAGVVLCSWSADAVRAVCVFTGVI